MTENKWNGALSYLETSRFSWWNNDYMEFLVKKVWKIKEPVSLMDFGCGIGFLGELIMPILPKGSSYTGIDIGDKLINEADRRLSPKYKTKFIHADLTNYISEEKADIAICQTLLQHIPDPIKVLEKMKNSVKPHGMVVCIELSRDVTGAAMYIDGLDYGKLNTLGVEQKLRRNSLDRVGKDFEIGLKLPVYMEQIGLKNVGVRVNDHVQYMSPAKKEYENERRAFMSGEYETPMKKEDKQKFVDGMVSRGLTVQEAEGEFDNQLTISDYIYAHLQNLSAVKSNCMFITYGYNED